MDIYDTSVYDSLPLDTQLQIEEHVQSFIDKRGLYKMRMMHFEGFLNTSISLISLLKKDY